ncbi:MAG TPA: hypothetical protein VNM91_12330 [Dehalococcoidia bacterium]|nr:hypothetical protein [Dehalococcoidia bacterium]
MTASEHANALERDLKHALEDLQSSLARASDAAARINELLPRLETIGSVFEEIDAVLRSAREQFGISGATEYSRPTLVVPRPQPAASQPGAQTWEADVQPQTPAPHAPASEGALISFRLEFESDGAPLDLRSVDDAVGEHPAVRDVALLDYDGRKATLKVWIDGASDTRQVQAALIEKASALFAPEAGITVTALEDAA